MATITEAWPTRPEQVRGGEVGRLVRLVKLTGDDAADLRRAVDGLERVEGEALQVIGGATVVGLDRDEVAALGQRVAVAQAVVSVAGRDLERLRARLRATAEDEQLQSMRLGREWDRVLELLRELRGELRQADRRDQGVVRAELAVLVGQPEPPS